MVARDTNRQRGQALALALMVLAVGSLVIVPTLGYTSSQLRGVNVYRHELLTRYAADSAAEYSWWRLKYDTLTDEISIQNPSDQDYITVNGIQVAIDTSIPTTSSPESPPVITPGKHLHVGVGASPAWIKFNGTINYTVVFTNWGTSAIVASQSIVYLPLGFTYVPGSTSSTMTTGEPTVTGDGITTPQVITWQFDGPATYEGRKIKAGTVGQPPGPEQSKPLNFSAIANVDAGIYYITAVGLGSTGEGDNSGPAAPVWSSIYRGHPRGGNTSVHVTMAVHQDGSVEVLSYEYW